MSAAPAGYLALIPAADHVVTLDPAAGNRGRLVLIQALRSGKVEVVEIVAGELVQISAAELAAAEFDFASGRMKRAGAASRPQARLLPNGSVDAREISVRAVFSPSLDPDPPGTVRPPEPRYEPPVTPRFVPKLAPPAPDHNNFPPGVTALGGPPPDRFANVVTYTEAGETRIDMEATRQRQAEAVRAAGRARSDRPPETAAEAGRAAWVANLTEEAAREQMERAAGSLDYQPARATAVGVHGDEWGPVIFALIADVTRFVKPPPQAPAAPAIETSPPEPASEAANLGGRPAKHDWLGARQAYHQRCWEYGLPATKAEASDEIGKWFAARGGPQPNCDQRGKFVATDVWPLIEALRRPPEIIPDDDHPS